MPWRGPPEAGRARPAQGAWGPGGPGHLAISACGWQPRVCHLHLRLDYHLASTYSVALALACCGTGGALHASAGRSWCRHGMHMWPAHACMGDGHGAAGQRAAAPALAGGAHTTHHTVHLPQRHPCGPPLHAAGTLALCACLPARPPALAGAPTQRSPAPRPSPPSLHWPCCRPVVWWGAVVGQSAAASRRTVSNLKLHADWMAS
jgi:hypothetical protein